MLDRVMSKLRDAATSGSQVATPTSTASPLRIARSFAVNTCISAPVLFTSTNEFLAVCPPPARILRCLCHCCEHRTGVLVRQPPPPGTIMDHKACHGSAILQTWACYGARIRHMEALVRNVDAGTVDKSVNIVSGSNVIIVVR